jgi:hypothetical protein
MEGKMAKAFGIPGLWNASMRWLRFDVDGRKLEYRRRLWKGNPIGYYVKSKSEGIDKQFVNVLMVDEAIGHFLKKFPKVK